MKYIINKTNINLKFRIKEDEYIKNFIFKNINYRRKVWNNFVEEANKYMGDYHMYDNFNPLHYKVSYFNKFEEPYEVYDVYCVGISEQVAKDMNQAIKMIKTNNKKVFNKESSNKLGTLRFKSFDRYYGSFKVHTKSNIQRNKFTGRIKILDTNTLEFRVRGGKKNGDFITLNTYEPLYDNIDLSKDNNNTYTRYYDKNKQCIFNSTDIKEISFIHELGKFYIQLSITCDYVIDKKDVKSRIFNIAGIDTGIHHPAVIYDGERYIKIEMPQKVSNKLHYLERRANRIQHHMDNKYRINKKNGINPYSHNYEKLRYKFRKIWKRIVNIRKDWIRNMCKSIANRYKKIVVDRFNTPDNSKNNNYTRKTIRQFNYINRFHSMYLFNEYLVHACVKYGCKYIEAPKNTTCTCNNCGHKNPHLPLSQRMFKCEECGYTIDRDYNASKNCYAYA